jgi:hypothetical protein
MAAAMALMESPAIIFAVLMANRLRVQSGAQQSPAGQRVSMGKILHESFTDGAQLLLLGAMLIGMVSGESGQRAMQPFSGDRFKGMLAFFLLDMGLMAARNLPGLRGQSPWLLAYGLLAPLVHAGMALGLCWLLEVPQADAVLLMVLAASASYIAVPAVLRYALPEANPSLYVGLSLGLTFPFNILLGIPLYARLATQVLGLARVRLSVQSFWRWACACCAMCSRVSADRRFRFLSCMAMRGFFASDAWWRRKKSQYSVV